MKSFVRLIVSLAVFGYAYAAAWAEVDSPPGPKLKVGVCTALTGGAADFGGGIRDGVLLAQHTLNKNNEIEFLIEDDGFQAKNAVTIVRKFIDQDKVDALLVFGSGSAAAAAPIAEQNRVPMIYFATSGDFTAGRSYVFQHFATAKKENEAVVAEVKRRGYKTLAVVTNSHEGMQSLRRQFMTAPPAQVVYDEEIAPSETDFHSEITKLMAVHPDAAYLVLLPARLGVFARQLKELGYRGEIFSIHSAENKEEVASAHGALNGSWFVSIRTIKDPTYEPRFKEMFGREPFITSTNGYDAAKMLYDSLASGQSLTEYLRALNFFNGAMGTYGLGLNNAFDVPVQVKKVTDQGFELVN